MFLVRCSFVEYFKNKLQHIKRLDDVLNEIFLIDDYIMGRMVMRDEELTIFRSVLPLFDKGLDIGDVAVGGGNFLVVVYDELNKLEYLLRGRDSFVSNLKNILRKNLFGLVGFDIDEKACTITKFRLMLKYIEHFYFWKDRIGTW
ncbi:MAG: hypothetical protein D6707_01025 [Bacteroidetes bacterium]|nr:MAG: hypothetical protein D6707_01025 [Bacteroidota bacterium]